jgi:hypothetical protein
MVISEADGIAVEPHGVMNSMPGNALLLPVSLPSSFFSPQKKIIGIG